MEQRWPPFGHFKSGDQFFLQNNRYGSATYIRQISVQYLVRLGKFPGKYTKNSDFGIQNGRQSAILDLATFKINRVLLPTIQLQPEKLYGSTLKGTQVIVFARKRRRRRRGRVQKLYIVFERYN